MKLTKLLPIATVASAAAIVTPLVTSCGTKWQEYEFTDGYKFVDQKIGSMKESEATQTYINDVDDNNKIFVDDFIKAMYSDTKSSYESHMYFGVSNVNTKDARLSMRIRVTASGTDEAGQKVDGDGYESIENWPIKIVYLDDSIKESGWYITCPFLGNTDDETLANMRNDKSWSAKMYSKAYDPVQKKYVEDKQTVNYETKEDSLVVMILSEFMLISSKPSYYLQKVTKTA